MAYVTSFSQRGGAWFDVFRATWPFAKNTVTIQTIELSCFFKKYILEKSQIIVVRMYKGFFSKGLIIEHNRTEYPQRMVYWPVDFHMLKKHLENLGYLVDG
jgi:hypothetical protein